MPYAFEEGNMANISKIVIVYIFVTPIVTKNILIGVAFTLEEVVIYKVLLQ